MNLFRRLGNGLLRGLLLGLALLGPMIVGVVPWRYEDSLAALAVGGVFGFVFGALWVLSELSSARSRTIVVVVVSCFLSVTILDVVARPLIGRLIAPDLKIEWPPMPLVRRYLPNVRFTGTITGGVASSCKTKTCREYRDGSFTTDRFGFPNEGISDAPLDVIVLGNSYAMGENTAQAKAWPTLLSKAYGLHVYNLAVAGGGPWQEYTDLTLEVDRLKLRPQGTVVLWMLFAGNDLLDPCYPIFRKDQLPWRKGLTGFVRSLPGYQKQSPLYRLWGRIMKRMGLRSHPPEIVAKPFLDGTDIVFHLWHAREAERTLGGVRDFGNYDCVRQTIVAMRRFAESKHLTVAILVVPPKEEVYSWVLHDGRPWSTTSSPSGFALAIRDIAREEQIPFVDMKPALVEASQRVYRESKTLLWWRDDMHWNVEGNREAAASAYKLYLSVTSGGPPQ